MPLSGMVCHLISQKTQGGVHMKRIKYLMVVVLAMFLVACGEKDEFTGIREDARYSKTYQIVSTSKEGVFYKGTDGKNYTESWKKSNLYRSLRQEYEWHLIQMLRIFLRLYCFCTLLLQYGLRNGSRICCC